MSDLSWLVVHGAVVWRLELALFLLLGLALAWVLPGGALRRRARRIGESFGVPETTLEDAPRGAPITLEGTVCSGREAPTTGAIAAVTLTPEGVEHSDEPTGKAVTAVRNGTPLSIDVNGQRVILEGAPQVLVGSRETGRCVTTGKAHGILWDFAAHLGTLPARRFGIRTLSFGDRVRVVGVLRHQPDSEAASTYRHGNGAYCLGPAEGGTSPLPVAFSGAPRALARGRARAGVVALAAPVVALAFLGAIGEIAVRVDDARGLGLNVAATTPLRRADALAKLREALPLDLHADQQRVARAAHIDTVRGHCAAASDDWLLHGQPSAAESVAMTCGDHARAAGALFAMGEFSRAAIAFAAARKGDPHLAPTVSEITAYLVTGNTEAAATTTRALLAAWEGPAGSREQIECVADALDGRLGRGTGVDNLEVHARLEGYRMPCTLLLLDTVPAEEHDRRNEALRRTSWVRNPNNMLTLMLLAKGAERERELFEDLTRPLQLNRDEVLSRPKQVVVTAPLALLDEAFTELDGAQDLQSLLVRARLGQRRAALASFAGDDVLANKILHDVREALEPLSQSPYTEEQYEQWMAIYDSVRRNFPYNGPHEDQVQGKVFAERARQGKTFDHPAYELARRAKWELREIDQARAVVALHLGDTKEANALTTSTHGLGDLMELITAARERHDPLAIDRLARGDVRESNRRLWHLASAGDGASLATRMKAQGLDGRGIIDVVGAHIPEGREQLQNWVRWSYPPPCTTCGLFPLLNYAASRRDAAVAVGDAQTAGTMREFGGRIHVLLGRRDIAVPLQLLSELYPP